MRPECGEAWIVLTGAAAVLAVFLVRGFAVLALVAVAFLVAGAFLVVVVVAAPAVAVFVLFFGAAFFAVVVVLGLVSLVSFYHVVSKEWR